MPCRYHTERRVEFVDTDMAGIAHFSTFFRFMESVEHEFYRAVGLPLEPGSFEADWGLPRVHAECDYRTPARFQDLLQVHLEVERLSPRTATYAVRFEHSAGASTKVVAEGRLVICCVQRDPRGLGFTAAPFPAAFTERIRAVHPADSKGNTQAEQ
jgi:acyl-CoA thioester hydrolase